MKFNPMPLAFKYCVGHGLELGAAAHNPFDLPDCKSVAPSDGVNYMFPKDLVDYGHYKVEQLKMSPEVKVVDLIGDFQNIPAEDGSLDYIISSHVIEHEPNFIAAMVECDRALKDGGVFFCIFPKRTAEPTDGPRALTTLQKVVADYDNGISMAVMPEDTWRGHYGVFSLQSMISFINYINQQRLGSWLIECVEETDSKVGNGHTIVLRKLRSIHELNSQPPELFYGALQQMITAGEHGPALAMLKTALSFSFRNASNLHAAALLSKAVNADLEAVEFLRQALVVDPENEEHRRDFARMTGTLYRNPVL